MHKIRQTESQSVAALRKYDNLCHCFLTDYCKVKVSFLSVDFFRNTYFCSLSAFNIHTFHLMEDFTNNALNKMCTA